MAILPLSERATDQRCALRSFRASDAATVASWVRTPAEAYHLAPRTPPPITAQSVIDWRAPGHSQLVLTDARSAAALAYGELNVLNGRRSEYWLGHLVVDPDRRGEGLGLELTRQLLERAFDLAGARRVCLVVFSDNRAAVECYKAAGLVIEGWETHELLPYRRTARLLRMAALRSWR